MSDSKPYRVLSIDGGGTRGVLAAEIIRRLEAEVPGFLTSADLVAGTSTGAILAAAVALGKKGDEIVGLYRDNAKRIFKRTAWARFADLFGLEGALYDSEPLAAVLQEQFGDVTLDQLPKEIVIPAVATDRIVDGVRQAGPKFYTRRDRGVKVVDACRHSAAAPIFFPAVAGLLRGRVTPFVDGGVCANNPSDSAIAYAIKRNVSRRSIAMLSLGTGMNPHYIKTREGKNLDWGLRDWGTKLLTILMEPGTVASHYRSEWLLEKGRYFRLSPILARDIPLDDVAAVPELIDIGARTNIDGAAAFLRSKWCEGAA